MSNTSETDLIKACLKEIEGMLAWGDSKDWSNYDFEKLSEAIFEKTKVRLSTTTLKRVWGRIKYDHAPNTATLNTLAQFAGFDDWRNFIQNNDKPDISNHAPAENLPPEIQHIEITKPKHKRRLPLPWTFGLVFLIAVASYFVFQNVLGSGRVDPAHFSFKADKVYSEGVPNSVVFTYNASQAKTDSVYIVQTWDISRKTLVPKHQSKHSAIYYYPGYFNTRLIVDGEVVKRHVVQITSDGWLGLVEMDEKPFYFAKKDITKPDRIAISEDLLKANNFNLKPVAPRIRLFNQRDMGDLRNDNFEFETTLRNDYKEGGNTCQPVEVLIQCKDDIIFLPLGNPACIGELKMYAAGKMFDAKFADLSGFGANLSEWTTLRVVCRDKKMQVFVNNKKALEFTFPNAATGIVGLQYRFNGVGEVKGTWFKDAGGRRIDMAP
ncbi:DUF1080 domain-containing protein [Dyadobacter chenwenxiniae]|uniref:DUF1080 domain-containing protein n=1 Tax=Dyadobacter chenwenxiniae TaxID=2906456 RepID=A0A9X1PRI2_9BACT|nr:DUF1080 domain-containing protein [Dyadobacter chenwenxiniae]MCF0065165.1 DUF1080 domain-containing protein [Dyadobacter chenwenxiniae]UON84565.1 DUF1080 domain-containing protein [Dyadobacter chenwenxiniae]